MIFKRIVDAVLLDENKWIEIKGYFRDDAKEKWEWFCSKYPSSELWDQKRLKEIGILAKKSQTKEIFSDEQKI